MRPLRSAEGLVNWLLRFSIVAYIVASNFHVITKFSGALLKQFSFYLTALYLLFSILLFIGGFMVKHSLSVLSGFFIFIISGIYLVQDIIVIFKGVQSITDPGIYLVLMCTGIGLYFLAKGNKG